MNPPRYLENSAPMPRHPADYLASHPAEIAHGAPAVTIGRIGRFSV